jgi:predicted nucleic acid-binding protein
VDVVGGAWHSDFHCMLSGATIVVLNAAAMIALAISLHADMVLIDERRGVKLARNQGLRVTGTLGLLELAAQSGLVDFTEAVERLRLTTFRSPEALLDTMLRKHRR